MVKLADFELAFTKAGFSDYGFDKERYRLQRSRFGDLGRCQKILNSRKFDREDNLGIKRVADQVGELGLVKQRANDVRVELTKGLR